jgi:hypothetical protein
MQKSISRTISEFAVNLQYKDLPQNVIPTIIGDHKLLCPKEM